jgi:hypothetical protein
MSFAVGNMALIIVILVSEQFWCWTGGADL